MNDILEQIDRRLIEMRAPYQKFESEADFIKWLEFQGERAKNKAGFKKMRDDKKLINKLKKMFGLRK